MNKKYIKLLIITIFCKLYFFSANAQQLNLNNENDFLRGLLNQGIGEQLLQFREENNYQDNTIIEDPKNSFSLDEINQTWPKK